MALPLPHSKEAKWPVKLCSRQRRPGRHRRTAKRSKLRGWCRRGPRTHSIRSPGWVHAGAQLAFKGRDYGALVSDALPVDQVKSVLEGPSLYLTVTFAAVPVQDVAVNGPVCGVD